MHGVAKQVFDKADHKPDKPKLPLDIVPATNPITTVRLIRTSDL